MDPNILIYAADGSRNEFTFEGKFRFEIWKPKLLHFKPSNKGYKYVLYWLFHYLGIFSNKHYCSLHVKKDGKEIASMLIVPKYFKWPFMDDADVQFTYVLTDKSYRGRGIASNMIQFIFNHLGDSVNQFWYVTDTSNKASIAVAKKNGFKFIGKGKKLKMFNRIELINAKSDEIE